MVQQQNVSTSQQQQQQFFLLLQSRGMTMDSEMVKALLSAFGRGTSSSAAFRADPQCRTVPCAMPAIVGPRLTAGAYGAAVLWNLFGRYSAFPSH